MFEKIAWGAAGLAAGSLIPAAALSVDYLIVNRQEAAVAAMVSRNPVYFFLGIVPVLAALLTVLYVHYRALLKEKSEELEQARGQLENTEQQAEIRNLMKELSVNLDHLVDITNNIREGICVVDKNHAIEFGYNRQFLEMFGQGDYIGKSLYDTIFRDIPAPVKKELSDFLGLCFTNTATSDDMINDVNPVSRFTLLRNEDMKVRERIMVSKVVRIKNLSGDVENVMFIFNDITLDEKLDIAFERQEKAFQDELEVMSLIYKNDRDIVNSFIDEMNAVLEKIQDRYVDIRQDETNTDLLYDIQSIVHLIKGEAFSLGFNEIALAARDFEEFIKVIGARPVTMENNLRIIELYEALYGTINKVNSVAQKMFSSGPAAGGPGEEEVVLKADKYREIRDALSDIVGNYRKRNMLTRDLVNLQKKIDHLDYIDMNLLRRELAMVNEKAAMENNKRSILNFIYDVDGLSEGEYRALKEVLIHLIRNSVAHGIEDVRTRRERRKDDAGRINIHLYEEDSGYAVLYSDDGAGFDLEKIKARAVAGGLITRGQADRMTEKEIIRLVFRKGFSTNEDPDMVSGVGIGMSAVREAVTNTLKGSLRITNKPGRGITGKIFFPAGSRPALSESEVRQ